MSEAPEVLRFYDDELSRTLEFMTRGGNNKYVRADCIEELELAVRYEADLAQMALDARKELEAKLAKAVTELKMFTDVSKLMQSATSHNKRRHNTVITDTMWAQWSKQLRFALTALAELKGQDDE